MTVFEIINQLLTICKKKVKVKDVTRSLLDFMARNGNVLSFWNMSKIQLLLVSKAFNLYLTVILRGRAGYELIYITNQAVGRVGYYQLIFGKSEKNNCFSKFSSNFLDFFGWNLLKLWHFLYWRRREKFFCHLQNLSTRNSPSVFPYLVKFNDNGSHHGLREPIRKLENHYPEPSASADNTPWFW